jgi:16S rRNA (cytidine1402-2'-O)-methyltransferase
MGTLYVTGVPAAHPDDITARALRHLAAGALILADQSQPVRELLAHHRIQTPVVACDEIDTLLATLDQADVCLLVTGWSPAPSPSSVVAIRAAMDRGFPIVPVPGPALPLAALVVSGLPAGSFVYLGSPASDRTAWRQHVSQVATEPRTLVVTTAPGDLDRTLAELHAAWGERPLVVTTAADRGFETLWRGTLGQAPAALAAARPCVLVTGGASEPAPTWAAERVHAELAAYLEQGLGAKESSRRLAAESGWPRRKIYRLAVEFLQGEREGQEQDAGP